MNDRLIQAAIDAREKAYAPYSNFAVGAALLTLDGQVISGVNVENASYGLTICAERVAIGTAVTQGYREFKAVAVVSNGGVTPCGACRQVLAQFGVDMEVIAVDATLDEDQRAKQVKTYALSALLPETFIFDGPTPFDGPTSDAPTPDRDN